MLLIYTIEAFGLEPSPWKVPDIGVARRNGGKQRFARVQGKSTLGLGHANMKDWQTFVGNAARAVVGNRKPETGPLRVEFTFFGETPPGKRQGQIWDVRLEWDEDRGTFVKKKRYGRGEADVTNLQKCTEDALKGVICVDDCQVRSVSSECLFGPIPGVRIRVRRIEPDDYPGVGQTVKE